MIRNVVVGRAHEDAYRTYDLDAEHNRIRAEMFAPISEIILRAQFRLPV